MTEGISGRESQNKSAVDANLNLVGLVSDLSIHSGIDFAFLG